MVIMGLPCTATLLHMAFPLSAPLGAFSSGPSVRIKASSPWELQRWYGNRLWELLWLLTAGADYLCLPKCPNSYLQRVCFFFLCLFLWKEVYYWKLHFPAQILKFLIFSSGSYYGLDAEFLLCNFITCMLSLLRGSQKAAVSDAVLKIVSEIFLSKQRDAI